MDRIQCRIMAGASEYLAKAAGEQRGVHCFQIIAFPIRKQGIVSVEPMSANDFLCSVRGTKIEIAFLRQSNFESAGFETRSL